MCFFCVLVTTRSRGIVFTEDISRYRRRNRPQVLHSVSSFTLIMELWNVESISEYNVILRINGTSQSLIYDDSYQNGDSFIGRRTKKFTSTHHHVRNTTCYKFRFYIRNIWSESLISKIYTKTLISWVLTCHIWYLIWSSSFLKSITYFLNWSGFFWLYPWYHVIFKWRCNDWAKKKSRIVSLHDTAQIILKYFPTTRKSIDSYFRASSIDYTSSIWRYR